MRRYFRSGQAEDQTIIEKCVKILLKGSGERSDDSRDVDGDTFEMSWQKIRRQGKKGWEIFLTKVNYQHKRQLVTSTLPPIVAVQLDAPNLDDDSPKRSRSISINTHRCLTDHPHSHAIFDISPMIHLRTSRVGAI